MPKFALIENVSFKIDDMLENISKTSLSSRFETGVTYCDFNGTLDLFQKVNNIIGKNMVEIDNCSYDKTCVIQSMYIENDTSLHQKIIFVKRKLRIDDSYTFLEFNPDLPDIYEYEDITPDDLINLLYNKYVHTGIILYPSGQTETIEYMYNDPQNSSYDPSYGSIVYKRSNGSIHSIKYLHLINIMQNLEDDSPDKKVDESVFHKKMEEKMNEFKCTHLYNQRDFSIGTFNCYYSIFGEQQNQIMSKLLNDNVYGNVIITLETRLNGDERLLNLDSKLFEVILNTISNSKFVQKNKHYFNIFYELL